MRALISKSHLSGTVTAPPSKSYTIRGLICAALTNGTSELVNPLLADDTLACLNILRQVGIYVNQQDRRWQITSGNFHSPQTDLFCNESATTLRFMTAVCSLVPGNCRLVTGPSLAKRPVGTLIRALRQLGVDCASNGEVAPITVSGGLLRGGTAELPGDISSQFVSALLMIAPLAEAGVTIRLTTPPESKPYILMTLDCMGEFGIKVTASQDLGHFQITKQAYQPAEYIIEGDWSSASYPLALGAAGGSITVPNLNPDSQQGDRVILDLLKAMGAQVKIGHNTICAEKAKLNAIQADLTDYTDLLPTLAVLAAVARGTSHFTGIERARIKESNRVAALREGLAKMGIKVKETANSLSITGGTPQGALIDSRQDHRIAMAFSLLGTIAGATTIEDAECVSKTYPEFWNMLKSIGGEVKLNGQQSG